ncbi:MAG: lipid II:glycine glycyltransferase FemX [Oscillospiraceae bacterium]
MELIDKSNSKILEEYEQFVSESTYGYFSQSLKWCNLKNNWGWDAVISRGADGKIRGTCLVLIKKVPVVGMSILYAPRGPVCDITDKEVLNDLMDGIKELAIKYKSIEFICDPCIEESDEASRKILEEFGFSHERFAKDYETIQTRNNYMLRNIKGKTLDEIMLNFKPDWRNRIRKAPKKGVYCEFHGAEALDDFYPIMMETGERDGFRVRQKEYFERMLNSLGEDMCRLVMCYVDEDGKKIPLSGAIAVQYAGKTAYVYGASANHHRNLYPNYLMQWEMIQWAVKGNCSIYDFQGIPNYTDENSKEYGVYRFKKGFNGEVVTFEGEFTYVYKPLMKKAVALAQGVFRKMNSIRRALKKKKNLSSADNSGE